MGQVQDLLGHSFQFPRLVMVGEQSSGKTSVIEAIIGAGDNRLFPLPPPNPAPVLEPSKAFP